MPDALSIVLFIASVSLLTAAIFFLLWAVIEPYILKIEYVNLPELMCTPKLKDASQGSETTTTRRTPELRIAFFSDLHGRGCRIQPEKLCDALLSSAPDMIVFGGDICERGKSIEPGLNYLGYIAERSKNLGVPCYAVRGNHDILISGETYHNHGFRLLVNETVTVKSRLGQDYLLIGLDDSGRKPRIFPEVPQLIEKIPPKRRICIVHNPDYIFKVNHKNFNSMISGHLHGGQIYLPFKLEYRLLRGDRLPKEGINRGLFERNGIRGYISRGCGCVLIPLRLFSPPEVSIIDFNVCSDYPEQ